MIKAFHALEYDGPDAADVIVGVGGLTEARTATIYLPDVDGVWQAFTSGVPGKVYANGKWWLYGSPAATNQITQSFDLADAAWVKTGTSVAVLDAIGLRGDANGATTLTDDDAGAFESTREQIAIPDDSNTNIFRLFILKDTDVTRFPELRLQFTGGTEQRTLVQLNTQTGAVIDRAPIGTVAQEVNDVGDWWEVLLSVANDGSGNTTATVNLFPAATTSLGVIENTAVGSIIVGNVELHLNKTIAQVRGSTPIFTSGSTVTVDATDLSFDDANHVDLEGAYFLELKNVGLDASNIAGLVSVGSAGRIITNALPTGFRSSDGTNLGTGPAITLDADDVEYKVGLAYGSSKMRVNTDDVFGTEANYDGVYDNAVNKLAVLSHANPAVVSGIPTPVLMRNLRRYDMTYDEAIIEIPNMMNGIFPSEGNFYLAITRRTAKQMRPKQRMAKPTRGLFR